jgi:hypothetical protein
MYRIESEVRCSVLPSYGRLGPGSWMGRELPPEPRGAGEGNRTPITSLEGWSSTIELHPHVGFWSGREDLNLRPPAPKAGALPGCATPRPRSAGSISECGTCLEHGGGDGCLYLFFEETAA